jgi:hypothetical protein
VPVHSIIQPEFVGQSSGYFSTYPDAGGSKTAYGLVFGIRVNSRGAGLDKRRTKHHAHKNHGCRPDSR